MFDFYFAVYTVKVCCGQSCHLKQTNKLSSNSNPTWAPNHRVYTMWNKNFNKRHILAIFDLTSSSYFGKLVLLILLALIIRESVKNPRHGNFPLGGYLPPPEPPRTRIFRKVSGKKLTEKGGTPPPPSTDNPFPKTEIFSPKTAVFS